MSDDDPFAEFALQVGPYLASAGASSPFADDDDLESVEPIPGYDGGVSSTRAAAKSVPPPVFAPPVFAPPVVVPPVFAPPVPTFRPTLGRSDGGRMGQGPANRPGSTFQELAALPAGTVDPWSDLDILDLRTTGRPGPLPVIAARTSAAPPPVVRRAPQGRAPRVPLSVKVGVASGSNYFTALAGNVARGGIFLASSQLLPVGAQADLFFELPDGHAVSVQATVCWARDRPQTDSDDGLPGMGLRFLELSHDDEVLIERYVGGHLDAASASNNRMY